MKLHLYSGSCSFRQSYLKYCRSEGSVTERKDEETRQRTDLTTSRQFSKKHQDDSYLILPLKSQLFILQTVSHKRVKGVANVLVSFYSKLTLFVPRTSLASSQALEEKTEEKKGFAAGFPRLSKKRDCSSCCADLCCCCLIFIIASFFFFVHQSFSCNPHTLSQTEAKLTHSESVLVLGERS